MAVPQSENRPKNWVISDRGVTLANMARALTSTTEAATARQA